MCKSVSKWWKSSFMGPGLFANLKHETIRFSSYIFDWEFKTWTKFGQFSESINYYSSFDKIDERKKTITIPKLNLENYIKNNKNNKHLPYYKMCIWKSPLYWSNSFKMLLLFKKYVRIIKGLCAIIWKLKSPHSEKISKLSNVSQKL